MTDYKPTPEDFRYSDPEKGESPALVRFDNLNKRTEDRELPIKDDKGVSPRFRLLELPRTDSNEVFLHIYNNSSVGLRLRYYGLNRGGEVEALPGYGSFSGVAGRFPVSFPDGFDAYLVRIGIGLDEKEYKTELDDRAYFSVAAYADREPASPGGLKLARNKEGEGSVYLPFSHDERSFQRIVISTCDPEEDIRPLLTEINLEKAESYFGEKGSVVAVGVPPGMSLNTVVETTEDIRQRGHTGGGTVSKDYIVNLFAPDRPTQQGEGKAKWNDRRGNPAPDMTAFNPPTAGQFAQDRSPLTVAIIDSGIDYSSNNAAHWKQTLYRTGPQSEYVRPGAYGYDFIRRRPEPIDEAPHGTYVAAALLNQYRSDRPLQLLHMKVFGEPGIASYFGSLVSIYEATAVGVRIINMSWGFYQDKEPRALYCALKTAANHGIIMVTSAGNDREDLDKKPQWPAAFADDFPCNLITVASYRYGLDDSRRVDPVVSNLAKAEFTNFGVREVPLAAFYTSPVPEFESGNTHFPTGTSISAPIVAGLLASWLADNPNGTLAEFRKTYYHPTTELATVVTSGHHIRHDNAPRMV